MVNVKIKKVLLLFVSTFILLRIIVWSLIGSCSALAPDETGYLGLFSYVNQTSATRPSLQWSNTPDFVLKLFFTPALILFKLGLSELTAFRIQSLLFSLGACLILIKTAGVLRVFEKFRNSNVISRRWIVSFISLFAFLPTGIIWSILGLREPYLYFALALFTFSVVNFFDTARINSFAWLTLVLVSLIVLGYTKFYIYLILLVSILFSLFVIRKKVAFVKIVAIFLISIFSLLSFTQQLSEIKPPRIEFKSIDFSFNFLRTDYSESLPSMTFLGITECIRLGTAGPGLISAYTNLEKVFPARFEIVRQQSELDPNIQATSATALRADESRRGTLNLLFLPLGILYFLFFPISVLSSGIFGLVGVLEIVFWIPMYLVLFLLIRKKGRTSLNIPVVVINLAFILLFVSFSALSEVNFGTAIRHRSILLVPILVTCLALWDGGPLRQRKSQVGRVQRGNEHPFS